MVFFPDYKSMFIIEILENIKPLRTKLRIAIVLLSRYLHWRSYIITCGFYVTIYCAYFSPQSMYYNLLASLPLLGHLGDFQGFGGVYECVRVCGHSFVSLY